MRQLGINFTIDPAGGDEPSFTGGDPHLHARKLSLLKAQEVAPRHPGALVLAADTFGIKEGVFIGKPHTAEEAQKMLASLSGKSHDVITGFTVLDAKTGKYVSRSAETTVRFRVLSQHDIDAYVATGEPLDKAGAYAIQGRGALLVEKIDGDYSNVVGLPLSTLEAVLKEFGVEVLPLPRSSSSTGCA